MVDQEGGFVLKTCQEGLNMSIGNEDRQKILEGVSPEELVCEIKEQVEDVPKKVIRRVGRSDTSEQFRNCGGKAYTVYIYWETFYSHGDSCSLCGGGGVIDTSDKPYGRKNFCICLEGQQMRAKEKGKYE